MTHVPRAQEFTGRKSNDEKAAEREWQTARKAFIADRDRCSLIRRANHLKPADVAATGKGLWKARVEKTRSA